MCTAHPAVGTGAGPDGQCRGGQEQHDRDVTDAEILLRNADVAMYQAKRGGPKPQRLLRRGGQGSGRGTTEPAERPPQRPRRREPGSRRAVRRGFGVVYQPIVDARGRAVSFEALCRWSHPHRGPVSPERFIAAAESAGLVPEVDHLVHGIALRALASWRSLAGSEALTMSVNASPHTLVDPNLADTLVELLGNAGLPGQALHVEVTEHALMEDPRAAIRTLQSLRSLGIRIGIDDFGTGHSSLAYIQDLPVDFLKIDRSFISPLAEGGVPPAIVTAIVNLARDLGLSVIAEGVETVEQRNVLTELGVDAMQGWLFSHPISAAIATTWLRQASVCEGTERTELPFSLSIEPAWT